MSGRGGRLADGRAGGLASGPAVVALGGGHGLSATLRALRRVSDEVTAVVGVSDDGGSSGRIRRELGLIPPGDLRMALSALCGDDTWGRTWARVLQHRFHGGGELAGHALGNLLIAALWEETGDPVAGLDWVAALLGAHGRVLPVALEPVELVAEVRGLDAEDPGRAVELRGQVEIATTIGEVLAVKTDPATPRVCGQAVSAIEAADVIVMGPGSWYTSVLPHLQVPQIHAGIVSSPALKVLVLNLLPQEGETTGFTADRYVAYLRTAYPELRVDRVVADPESVADAERLRDECQSIGGRLVLEQVAMRSPDGTVAEVHDPDLLASAFGRILAGRR